MKIVFRSCLLMYIPKFLTFRLVIFVRDYIVHMLNINHKQKDELSARQHCWLKLTMATVEYCPSLEIACYIVKNSNGGFYQTLSSPS